MEEAELPKVFGQVVRELRKQRGLSQERLATLAGIDRAYMGGLERGLRNPSLTTIARVATGLGMTMGEFVADVEGHSGLEHVRNSSSTGGPTD
jgi:transcriptional regulator with XRE-family HTH domain